MIRSNLPPSCSNKNPAPVTVAVTEPGFSNTHSLQQITGKFKPILPGLPSPADCSMLGTIRVIPPEKSNLTFNHAGHTYSRRGDKVGATPFRMFPLKGEHSPAHGVVMETATSRESLQSNEKYEKLPTALQPDLGFVARLT